MTLTPLMLLEMCLAFIVLLCCSCYGEAMDSPTFFEDRLCNEGRKDTASAAMKPLRLQKKSLLMPLTLVF